MMMNKKQNRSVVRRGGWGARGLLLMSFVVIANGVHLSRRSSLPKRKGNVVVSEGESIAHRLKMRRIEGMTEDEVRRYHGDVCVVPDAATEYNELAFGMATGTSRADENLMAAGMVPNEASSLASMPSGGIFGEGDSFDRSLEDLLARGGDMNAFIDGEMRRRASRRVRGVAWGWPVPHNMPVGGVELWDPVGDGNCLFWNLLAHLDRDCTLDELITLRHQINEYILAHPDECIFPNGYTIREWVMSNLGGMEERDSGFVVDNDAPILQYVRLMEDATPFRGEYGTELEAFVFGIINRRNVAIYDELATDGTYRLMMRLFVSDDVPTVCLLHCGGRSHYKLLNRMLGESLSDVDGASSVSVGEEVVMGGVDTDTNQNQTQSMNRMLFVLDEAEVVGRHSPDESDSASDDTYEENSFLVKSDVDSSSDDVMTGEEEGREKARLKKQTWRAGLPEEKKKEVREKARLRMQRGRANLSRDEKAEVREKDRLRKVGVKNKARRNKKCRGGIATECNIENSDTYNVEPFNCGDYDKVCGYCNALGYKAEMQSRRGKRVHFGKMCCKKGKVKLRHLPWLHRYEPIGCGEYELTRQQLDALRVWEGFTDEQRKGAGELYHLFVDNTKEARFFRNNIRKFNAAMSMASLQVSDATLRKGGSAAFKICGLLYRRVGPMLPSLLPDLDAACTQIYFLDPEYQAELRASRFKDAEQRRSMYQYDLVMFRKLHRILLECRNSYLRSFLSAYEFIQQRELNPDDIEYEIHPQESPRDAYEKGKPHPGRFHSPSVPEISILVPNEQHPGTERSVVCQMRQSTVDDPYSLKFVSEGSRAYEPLQYELLRPFGTDGWHYGTRSLKGSHVVSIPEYSRYHMMERAGEESMLHRSKKLFQQWVTDQYARAETRELRYLKCQAMQTKLRRDTRYNLLRSILKGNVKKSGRQTILPSSHTGSDRWYYKKFEDVMAFVGRYGKPHLWITHTLNVGCDDVKDRLRPGEQPWDRPDVLVRVFHIRNTALLDEIIKDRIFGEVEAYTSVIEFQKRGAPHSHSLIWLKDFDLTVKSIDGMISAEIPPEGDPGTPERKLHDLVKQHMLHKCEKWCQRNGCCKDHFPFDFVENTYIVEDAYPRYRRRSPSSGGNVCQKRYHRELTTVTNQNVVPYSPYLLMRYQSHINVQMCNSIRAIKYLCFYPLKGEDLMQIKVDVPDPGDEIGRHEVMRYISACSAALYLLEIPRVRMDPSVMQLQIHLENEEPIIYEPNRESAVKAAVSKQAMTPLKAYFMRNMLNKYLDPEMAAKELKYEEFPQHYVFDGEKKEWKLRQQRRQLGRMVAIHPQAGQLFYLRLLLQNKGGATSFEDLLTINGDECDTPKEACRAMELLEDDAQWVAAMSEAAGIKTNIYSLRNLFCAINLNCEVADPPRLFEMFREALSEDFLTNREDMPEEQRMKYVDNDLLLALNDIFNQRDKTNNDFGIPMPDESLQLDAVDNEEEYDPQAEEFFDENYPLLNEEQRAVFGDIKCCVDEDKPCFVHVDSPAGSGKTFLGNVMLSYVRKDGRIAVSTAMTGIAAILLALGTTAHKRFGFPIPCRDHSTSNISFDTKKARLLKEADLIIIDEVSCMTRWLLECLDRFLRELMGNDEVMGGKRVVLMGDFRQALPVVKQGRAQAISDSIKSSWLWRRVRTLRLKRNMRVEKLIHPDSTSARKKQLEDYAEFLLSVGDGTAPPVAENIIEIPTNMVCRDEEEVERRVYDNFMQQKNYKNAEYLRGRAILASTNDECQDANKSMVERLEGKVEWIPSVDECIDDDNKKIFHSPELNKVNASGLPPHRLPLKKDACIILIRNLNVKCRHVNGTRCIIEEIKPHVIKARLLDGGKYSEIFIPKIPIVCADTDFPVRFTRRQFPILLAYYLTFNRAQGQSLEKVGMRLKRSVFTHGLLYIGMSRTGDPMFVSIYADQSEFEHLIDEGILDPTKTYTRNIVFPEIFDEFDGELN